MKICSKCVLPSTKPFITFDKDGVCSVCTSHKSRTSSSKNIDWAQRAAEFDQLIDWVKSQNVSLYDAVVPVSGGKDSITQVDTLVRKGLRVLAVNVDYGIKTKLGLQNLALIPAMGANLITFRPELQLHKKLIRIGLEDFGDPDLMSHCLLHAYPIRLALDLNIPLVLLGENSAIEYVGTTGIAERDISKEWFANFAANKEHTAQKLADEYGISSQLLKQYEYPYEIEQSKSTRAVFLSYFQKWDTHQNLRVAQSHGFKKSSKRSEGTYRNFVGVDELINRVHQFLKVLKFGYGRATDHASEDIRLGLLEREEAKKLVSKYDFEPLSDKIINNVADFLEYTPVEFSNIVEGFRSSEIWFSNGRLRTVPTTLSELLDS